MVCDGERTFNDDSKGSFGGGKRTSIRRGERPRGHGLGGLTVKPQGVTRGNDYRHLNMKERKALVGV